MSGFDLNRYKNPRPAPSRTWVVFRNARRYTRRVLRSLPFPPTRAYPQPPFEVRPVTYAFSLASHFVI
jgi:hypothetical protein